MRYIIRENSTPPGMAKEVATVRKKLISPFVDDTYGVETAAGEDDILILAVVLAIDLTEDAERKSE